MQFYDGTAQVQTDACSLHAYAKIVLALIETVEEVIEVTGFDTYTIVDNLYLQMLVSLPKYDFDLSTVKGVFEGVGEQVGDDLVKLCTVNPRYQVVFLVLYRVCYVSLTGSVLIEFAEVTDKSYHVSLLTVEAHLVLVNLPFVEDLVDEEQQPLRISVDRLHICLTVLIVYHVFQLRQRTKDEGQWGTDVMRRVHQELHLLITQLHPLHPSVVQEDGD